MNVRLSEYHDLPAIQALYEASGKEPYPLWNWSCNLHGWWLLAEDAARRPLGCLQVYLSQPQAFLDLLCVPAAFPQRQRARIVRSLCLTARRLLASFGVQTMSFQADPSYGDWVDILTRYGAQPVHDHPTYIMQVS